LLFLFMIAIFLSHDLIFLCALNMRRAPKSTRETDTIMRGMANGSALDASMS
jgi:hypothetical protein